MSPAGDTFDATWSLASTASITSLVIDAGAGDAVFDVLSGIASTAGSANGRPFTVLLGGDLYDIVATYSGPVGLTGFPPVGDLYRFLRLDFTNQAFAGALTFGQDTDGINTPGDITQVPEPATALLLGIGLVGAGLRRFRRARV